MEAYEQTTCETLDMWVTFSELVEGKPAEVAFYTVTTLKNGSKMPCSQMAQVLDEDLLERLRSVEPGEQIFVSIETDWTKPDLPTVLTQFTTTPHK